MNLRLLLRLGILHHYMRLRGLYFDLYILSDLKRRYMTPIVNMNSEVT